MKLGEAYQKWTSISLILRIVVGIVIGVVLALAIPGIDFIGLPGTLFVNGLKAIAPFLVLFLIIGSIAGSGVGLGSRFRTVLILYIGSTIIASIVATVLSYAFPITITLPLEPGDAVPPEDMSTFLIDLISGIVVNPLSALLNGNYLAILFWAALFGFIIRGYGSQAIKDGASELGSILTKAVRVIIEFAPIGVLSIIYSTVSESGLDIFAEYGQLIMLLVTCMLIVMFITNPAIGGLFMRKNPYPLLIRCLKESGITAFFTRSSAANIPVNMALCERLGLDTNFYSVSIPLGATINMNGAAVTITVMTLCAAFTLDMDVPILTAMILCILATVAACGASGVSGGSLLLIPMACSFLGISEDAAMLMVAVGFVIGVIQDSVETMLNSSADVFYTAVSEVRDCRKKGEEQHFNF